MSIKYILRPSLTLFIIAAITIGALSVVHTLTLEPIERQKQKTQEAAMKEVLPQAFDYREISIEKTGCIDAVYEGHLRNEGSGGGTLTGYVVQLSPEGYSGKIDFIVGISIPDKKITGMRVLRHSETPGLGAQAVKEDFHKRYDGKDLIPLDVVRTSPGAHEIQAITSATITTRAITNAVNEAIEWYFAAQNKDGRK